MLTDPELDLLRELLADDPGDAVFIQVGRELIRRSQWSDAENVLEKGLKRSPDEEGGWGLLARASFECNHAPRALEALRRVNPTPKGQPEEARLELLVLEALSQGDAARRKADAYLLAWPDDVVATSLIERLSQAVAAPRAPIADPMVSIERAERYAVVGRIDRAVRVYRRLAHHEPGNTSVFERLRELERGEGSAPRTDDLSEEISDPAVLRPPDLVMPTPGLRPIPSAADEEVTAPVDFDLADLPERDDATGEAGQGEEEPTTRLPGGSRKKKRRGILRK